MRVLFVSRAFPPVVGGIEQQNADLARFLGEECELTLIANRRGKRFLPLFYPWAIARTLVLLPRHDALLLGDGVLALLGAIAKFFYPKKAVVSVLHGLDITYRSGLYQKLWVRGAFRSLDGAIAVSHATKDVAVKRGFDESKIFVIPNGIESSRFRFAQNRAALSALLGFDTTGTVILLTLGRLVKRKGAAWFIENVLPLLPAEFHYAVAGAGPEEAAIREAIAVSKTENRVHLLGRVADAARETLLGNADVFVQPNIPVPGDMEGFGIAVIEASAAGLPVVAANLEGLADAVSDGENGRLITPGDARAFADAIAPLSDTALRRDTGERSRAFTALHFDWNVIGKRYAALLEDFMKSVTNTH